MNEKLKKIRIFFFSILTQMYTALVDDLLLILGAHLVNRLINWFMQPVNPVLV